ncbi:MAG: protein-glutamine glutaminase family protein [Bdellovibrionota bacterium]
MGFLLLLPLLFSSPSAGAVFRKQPEPVGCKVLYAKTYGISARDEKELAENGGDFYRIRRPLYRAEAEEMSDKTLADLKNEPMPKQAGSRRIVSLNEEGMDQLFKKIETNAQVAETSLCDRYKNSEKQGFCFARAVASHLIAIQHGLHNKSVRKVWAIGRLDMDGLEWKYHVTTIARGPGGEWYAFDPPTFKGPVKIADWYKEMREKYDPSKTMRIVSTPASQLGILRAGKYDSAQFSRPAFNGFFDDLLVAIRQQNRAPGSPRPVAPTPKEISRFRKWMGGVAGISGISAAGMAELDQLSQAAAQQEGDGE